MLLPACNALTVEAEHTGGMPERSWLTWNPKLSTEQLHQQLAVVQTGAMHQDAVFLSKVVLATIGLVGTTAMAQHSQALCVS